MTSGGRPMLEVPMLSRIRRVAKSACNDLALVLMLPPYLAYALGGRFLGRSRVFAFWSQLLSLAPGSIGCLMRRGFYRLALQRCAVDSSIGFGTILAGPDTAIGAGVWIGPFCVLGEITIEDDVLIAAHVSIMNGSRQHGISRTDLPIRHQPGRLESVTIGRGSWIGERSVVMADVGRGAVVGAGAVVTRPVPDEAIVAGVPARILAHRRTHQGERPFNETNVQACTQKPDGAP
jgi:acetyltransferase-like isoleucine patch superfamily enzyme